MLLAERRARGTPLVRKYGNPSIREILVMTSPYDRMTDRPSTPFMYANMRNVTLKMLATRAFRQEIKIKTTREETCDLLSAAGAGLRRPLKFN